MELPCQVHGCDRTGAKFKLMVPAEMPERLQLILEAAEVHGRAKHYASAERLVREAIREEGCEFTAICDFHLDLLRDDKLEWIGKTGQRLVVREG